MIDMQMLQPCDNIYYHSSLVEGYIIGLLIIIVLLICIQVPIIISIYKINQQLDIQKEINYKND